jgi:hypothetical protein
LSQNRENRPLGAPSTGAEPDREALDSERTGRLLLVFVAVGFLIGAAVLIFAVRLDWA